MSILEDRATLKVAGNRLSRVSINCPRVQGRVTGQLSRSPFHRQPFPDMSSPRPKPWAPYVFTSISQALEAVA